jgi:PIN domain nuclease of toxin-antitoxin system
MKLLLDTHIFIWSDEEPERIPQPQLSAMEDETNDLVLSVASVWEMQIKIQIGKLKLRMPLQEIIDEYQSVNDLQILPIEYKHILALDQLPFHHKDPFDRLIIAQAIAEDFTLVSADPKFSAYAVKLMK